MVCGYIVKSDSAQQKQYMIMKTGAERKNDMNGNLRCSIDIDSKTGKKQSVISTPHEILEYIDYICRIEKETFNPPWTKDDFLKELESLDSCSMVIMEEKEKILGYLFAKKAADEININKLCIHPDYRGLGYGKTLLGRFIGCIRGKCSRVFLEVAALNTPAIRLYKGAGFRINRTRKNLYADGSDGLEMVLDILQKPVHVD